MLDLRDAGVRVTTVMPGSVATGFAGRSPDDGEDWKLSPEDVAEAVLAVVQQRSQALASPDRAAAEPSAGEAPARLASPQKTPGLVIGHSCGFRLIACGQETNRRRLKPKGEVCSRSVPVPLGKEPPNCLRRSCRRLVSGTRPSSCAGRAGKNATDCTS